MTWALLTAPGLQGVVATVRAAMSLASSLSTPFPGCEQNQLLQGRDVTFAKLTHHDLLHQQASWQIPAVLLWQNLSRIKEKIKLEVGNKCFSVFMPSSSWLHRGVSDEILGKTDRSQPKPTDFNPLSDFTLSVAYWNWSWNACRAPEPICSWWILLICWKLNCPIQTLLTWQQTALCLLFIDFC